MASWTTDKEQFALFQNGAIALLKTHKKMSIIAPTESPIPARALALWGAPYKYDTFASADLALEDFAKFAKDWPGWEATMSILVNARLELTLHVPFGKGYVTFSAQGGIPKGDNISSDDLKVAYRELWDYISMGYYGFAENPPKLASALGVDITPPPDDKKNVIKVECSHIQREDLTDKHTQKPKPYYKLFGGRYAEFGVRVWDEVLIEAGVKIEKVTAGKHPMQKGTFMFVELSADGKPVKVAMVQRPK